MRIELASRVTYTAHGQNETFCLAVLEFGNTTNIGAGSNKFPDKWRATCGFTCETVTGSRKCRFQTCVNSDRMRRNGFLQCRLD